MFSVQGQPDTLNRIDSAKVDSAAAAAKPHIYKMNYWTTGTFCVVATAANIYAIPTIIHGKKNIPDEEVLALNKNHVNGFDRWALYLDPSKRESFYRATDYILPLIVAASGSTFIIDKKMRKDFFQIGLMYYEMHAITFSMYDFSPLGPAFRNRIRPFTYYDYFPLSERKAGNEKNSMYSGHVASAVASTFFAVKVYCDYHPEIGGKKYLLYGIASIPPLIEGYLRVKALAHFPTDVLIGFGVGSICGILVPQLHKSKKQNVQFSLNYSPLGQQGLTVTWKLK